MGNSRRLRQSRFFSAKRRRSMAPPIHLRLHARRVDLRHEHLPDRPPQLAFALTHVLTDRDLRDIGAVLIKQPPPDPLRGVALLARRLAIGRKRLVDQRPVRAELRRRPRHRRALRRRQRRRQRLTHRTTVHPMALRQRPDRQPLPIAVTPDLLELLHFGSHSSVPPIRAQDEGQPSGHDRTEVGLVEQSQRGQFRPSFSWCSIPALSQVSNGGQTDLPATDTGRPTARRGPHCASADRLQAPSSP
jgi:hypothetical protein